MNQRQEGVLRKENLSLKEKGLQRSFQISDLTASGFYEKQASMSQSESVLEKFRLIFSHERFANTLLQINNSNVMPQSLITFLIIVDYAMLLYTPAMILYSRKSGIHLSEVNILEKALNQLSLSSILYFEIVMIGVMILINAMIAYLSSFQLQTSSLVKQNQVKHRTNILHKSAGFMVILICFFFRVPKLHIALRVFTNKNSDGAIYYYLSIFAAVIVMILTVQMSLLARLMTLRVPLKFNVLSYFDVRQNYLKLILNGAFIGAHILLTANSSQQNASSNFDFVVILVLLGVMCGLTIYNGMLVLYFDVIKTLSMNIFQATSIALLILACFEADYYLLVPFIYALFFVLNRYWSNRIYWKLSLNQLKIQLEFQYALYMLNEAVLRVTLEGERGRSALKFLFGFLRNHKLGCKNLKCVCFQSDSLFWAMSRFDRNQQLQQLEEEDMYFLNEANEFSIFKAQNIIENPYTVGMMDQETSYLVREKEELVDDLEFKEAQFSQFNHDSIKIDLYKIQKNNSSDMSNKPSGGIKVDRLILKKAFFSNLGRVVFDQAIKQFPNNFYMRLQFAHYALVNMKNIYLCINILRDFDLSKLSWLERVNLRLNEMTFIEEIEKLIKNRDEYENGFQMNAMGVVDIPHNQIAINNLSASQPPFLFDSSINPEHFIVTNKLYDKFYLCTSFLLQSVNELWRLLIDKDFNLNQLFTAQKQVSISIA